MDPQISVCVLVIRFEKVLGHSISRFHICSRLHKHMQTCLEFAATQCCFISFIYFIGSIFTCDWRYQVTGLKFEGSVGL